MTDIINSQEKKSTRPIPNCVSIMKPENMEHTPGQSLTISFPVQDIFLNGNGVMQGGFIAAAFDNAFGILLYREDQHLHMTTIELHVNYHRPLFKEDQLIITSYLKAKGNTIVGMYAEGYNDKGKLVATATTNMLLLEK